MEKVFCRGRFAPKITDSESKMKNPTKFWEWGGGVGGYPQEIPRQQIKCTAILDVPKAFDSDGQKI